MPDERESCPIRCSRDRPAAPSPVVSWPQPAGDGRGSTGDERRAAGGGRGSQLDDVLAPGSRSCSRTFGSASDIREREPVGASPRVDSVAAAGGRRTAADGRLAGGRTAGASSMTFLLPEVALAPERSGARVTFGSANRWGRRRGWPDRLAAAAGGRRDGLAGGRRRTGGWRAAAGGRLADGRAAGGRTAEAISITFLLPEVALAPERSEALMTFGSANRWGHPRVPPHPAHHTSTPAIPRLSIHTHQDNSRTPRNTRRGNGGNCSPAAHPFPRSCRLGRFG
jgi:hypothetical protein